MKYMGEKKSKLRIRCPEKVGGKLALVKEAALLTEQVERRKEWLPSRKFFRFYNKDLRNSPI